MYGYYGYYSYGGSTGLYILLLAAIVFSFWASWKVKHVYKKYAQDYNMRHISGAQAARRILDNHGLYNVGITQIQGTLTDYYDPKTNCISLSSDVYNGTSTVAVGVACHEVGHAIQYAENYVPIRIRAAIIPATNLGSKLAFPLIIGGAILSRLSPSLYLLIYAGIICFALSVVFQLITLPTEFNASHRALTEIENTGLLTDAELPHARQVLTAAAMTYVAALAVALLQLLRLIAIYGGNRRR